MISGNNLYILGLTSSLEQFVVTLICELDSSLSFDVMYCIYNHYEKKKKNWLYQLLPKTQALSLETDNCVCMLNVCNLFNHLL